ncbi:hypothetical protein BJ508DRAFT_42353 [Ascobolus immersus RN42]|uniref:Uncharacterized protein n=1 Tax=Ascobolus immersus RN42 TaxID=1160509 RepID=A0A3N4IDJ0_ASCIM|nr:hypothetical protein BJ508DRAFT_42353 [Ascobolus immersus RN42]
MASFFTLPLELHYEIASHLMPPPSPLLNKPMMVFLAVDDEFYEFGLDREFWRTELFESIAVDRAEDYMFEDHEPNGPIIIRLILAFGRGPLKHEPNNNRMGQVLRHLYTTELCNLLVKTFLTQELYFTALDLADNGRLMDPPPTVLMKHALWSVFEAFNWETLYHESFHPKTHRLSRTNPQLGMRQEFDFWRIFLSVGDKYAYTVPTALGWSYLQSGVQASWSRRLESYIFYGYKGGKNRETGLPDRPLRVRVGLVAAILEREVEGQADQLGSETSTRLERITAAYDALLGRYPYTASPWLDARWIVAAVEEVKGYIMDLLFETEHVYYGERGLRPRAYARMDGLAECVRNVTM